MVSVDQSEWDRLAPKSWWVVFPLLRICNAGDESRGGKAHFVKAFALNGECVGIAVSASFRRRDSGRFPRFCKTAVVGALPATKEGYSELEPAIMNFLERDLKARGRLPN